MICIRADGNQQIGTGHIMRCLSLADALREQGGKIMFVTAEPYFQRSSRCWSGNSLRW